MTLHIVYYYDYYCYYMKAAMLLNAYLKKMYQWKDYWLVINIFHFPPGISNLFLTIWKLEICVFFISKVMLHCFTIVIISLWQQVWPESVKNPPAVTGIQALCYTYFCVYRFSMSYSTNQSQCNNQASAFRVAKKILVIVQWQLIRMTKTFKTVRCTERTNWFARSVKEVPASNRNSH